MRHRKRGRRLGRSSSHRRALLRNLTSALFLTERDDGYYDGLFQPDGKTKVEPPKQKGRIVTTLHKAAISNISTASDETAKSGLQVHFRTVGSNTPLPIAIETGLYRIAQEALNNIIKYAQASEAGLNLRCELDGVVLNISDDGCGIPEEIKHRIFEPFFTTKDVGEGTGLGMSIAIGLRTLRRADSESPMTAQLSATIAAVAIALGYASMDCSNSEISVSASALRLFG